MDSTQHAKADDKGSPPPTPDNKDSPPADSSPPPSPPSPSPPSKDSPPSPSPPSPSPPAPSPPAPSPPSPSPPSPTPPTPSPPPSSPSTPTPEKPKDTSTPPPSPPSSGSTPPAPSPPSSDGPPKTDTPPPSPPSPTDGSTTPPGVPPAAPGTPPPATQTPPSAIPSPPGTPATPPLATSPHAPLGAPSPHNSSPADSVLPSAPSSQTPPPASTTNTPVVVGVVAGAVVVVAFIILCLACSKKKKKKQHDQYYNRAASQYNQQNMDHVVKFPSPSLARPTGTPTGATAAMGAGAWGTSSDSSYSGQHNQHQNVPATPMANMGGYASQSQFSYQELATATSGFSQENLLGQGGFGYVHKGVLANGTVVAVKSLKSGSGQGEREFQAEVEIISRVHHRHLVSLVGYCIAETQRMLVYEFVSNKTLEHHLHGKDVPVMDWASRLRIALGSAKGLAYLHEDCHPRIIHRDIKAANILLDENYEAMVADFGLAKLSSDNFTHVSTRVMGTFGYLAPEYASSGKLSDKSDVFSFGVMLLELVTGQRPVDPTGQMEDSLVDWSRPLMTKALEDGNYDAIADPRMEGNFDPDEMAHMIACASASVRHSAKRRPRMSQIVRSLEGDLAIDDMNVGPKNRLSNTTSGISTTSGPDSIYDTGAYNADMMKFRKMVLNAQETRPVTDDFGATTEHALDPNSPVSGVQTGSK